MKKEANMGRLPDQINANVAMVNGLRQSLDSYSLQLRTEQDRLEPDRGAARRDAPRHRHRGADLVGGLGACRPRRRARPPSQQELAQARALGYTDKHPDIERLKSEIAQADAELAAMKQGTRERNDDPLQADPIYRQRVADRDSARLQINTLHAQSRNASDADRRLPEPGRGGADGRGGSRVDHPRRRPRASALRRSEDSYDKRAAPRTSRGSRAANDSACCIRRCRPPRTPAAAAEVMAIAVVLGFVLGAALALGREFMDRSVHDARALQSEFEVPVLGEIPRIHGAA